MNWLRDNRFLGTFLIVLGVCTIGAGGFFFSAKSERDDAALRFDLTAAEWNRLERLVPFPSGENLRKMKVQADDYATALARLKAELQRRVLPVASVAPNEFQSRLRLAMIAVAGKARTNQVRLPDKFHLGFDEFASVLPNEVAAPLLGQELAQIESFLDMLFDARVDALTSFHRRPLPEEQGRAPAPSNTKLPALASPVPRLLDRNVIDVTFVSTPVAARKVLNQIAGAPQQFLITRLLHVRNERGKGPARELAVDAAGVPLGTSLPSPAGAADAKRSTAGALNFIVGQERVETSARIEIVRFAF